MWRTDDFDVVVDFEILLVIMPDASTVLCSRQHHRLGTDDTQYITLYRAMTYNFKKALRNN